VREIRRLHRRRGSGSVRRFRRRGILAGPMCGVLPAVLAVYDGRSFHQHKDEGMVDAVVGAFVEKGRGVSGRYGIGHVRYPTVGCGGAEDAQPFLESSPFGIALAHNGNLTNYEPLKKELEERDRRYVGSNCDAEVILHVLAEEMKVRQNEDYATAAFAAVARVFERCHGSYSVVAAVAGRGLLCFRDPFGIKPLIYGERTAPGDAFPTRMFVSESCALTASDFKVVRDVKSGEAILVHPDGRLEARQCAPPNHHPCIFEFIYFARPDSQIDDISVYKARRRLGRELAKEFERRHPSAHVDVVIPVPDSARPAAEAMADSLGKSCREGLLKDRYVGRTFIMPGQEARAKSVKRKLAPNPIELEGKRVLVVDDSIVRGTTSRQIVQLLRENGAKEVHFASTCPPLRNPCVYGIDMQTRQDFIAGRLEEDAICREIGADTLTYQTMDGMVRAVKEGNPAIGRFCMACMDGEYPTGDVDQSVLDRIAGERERDGGSRPPQEV
jgi:amidophosphoribosyltransferase